MIVAKQVLANSLYYHASFMLPSRELLAEIVDLLRRLVCGQGPLGRGPAGPPAAHSQQGCGVPDLGYGRYTAGRLPAQVHALQAKVAAMLLHPRRQAWK
jgi:hypothetical protein